MKFIATGGSARYKADTAVWTIHFYEKHGFRLVFPAEKEKLLRKYWSIPDRQVETSVVLADERWFEDRQGELDIT